MKVFAFVRDDGSIASLGLCSDDQFGHQQREGCTVIERGPEVNNPGEWRWNGKAFEKVQA